MNLNKENIEEKRHSRIEENIDSKVNIKREKNLLIILEENMRTI